MKTYIFYCVKGYDTEINGNKVHPVKAMVAEVAKKGSVYAIYNIKLIKCTKDLKVEYNKPCEVYFDEYGRAVEVRYINA